MAGLNPTIRVARDFSVRSTLAVEMRKLRLDIAASCGSTLGHCFLDRGKVCSRETYIQCSKRFGELVAPAGSF